MIAGRCRRSARPARAPTIRSRRRASPRRQSTIITPRPAHGTPPLDAPAPPARRRSPGPRRRSGSARPRPRGPGLADTWPSTTIGHWVTADPRSGPPADRLVQVAGGANRSNDVAPRAGGVDDVADSISPSSAESAVHRLPASAADRSVVRSAGSTADDAAAAEPCPPLVVATVRLTASVQAHRHATAPSSRRPGGEVSSISGADSIRPRSLSRARRQLPAASAERRAGGPRREGRISGVARRRRSARPRRMIGRRPRRTRPRRPARGRSGHRRGALAAGGQRAPRRPAARRARRRSIAADAR